jgi:phosphoenolpyruvate carboxylase
MYKEWPFFRAVIDNAAMAEAELLDNAPDLQHLIRVRNPYVDPLSYIQVALLGKLRRGEFTAEDGERAMAAVLVSVNGIAAGLKNTG